MVKKRVKKRILKTVNKFRGLRVHAFAHSSGMLALIAIVFYALFVWFGGYNGIEISGSFPIGFNFNDWTFIFGVMQAYVIWYVAGWIFAKIYNRSN